MSDENRGAGTGDGIGNNSTRIGTADRDEAIALLGEHYHAGRLDPGEHELRVTRAKVAVTRADLDVLFIDLPERSLVSKSSTPESTRDEASSGAGPFRGNTKETIMALVPFAAMALFFTTGFNWLWFLMIPVMGILLYGPGGAKHPRQGQRRGRGRDDAA